MTGPELNAEINRLHSSGKRQEVIALMRKYGIFDDEKAIADYLAGKDK